MRRLTNHLTVFDPRIEELFSRFSACTSLTIALQFTTASVSCLMRTAAGLRIGRGIMEDFDTGQYRLANGWYKRLLPVLRYLCPSVHHAINVFRTASPPGRPSVLGSRLRKRDSLGL